MQEEFDMQSLSLGVGWLLLVILHALQHTCFGGNLIQVVWVWSVWVALLIVKVIRYRHICGAWCGGLGSLEGRIRGPRRGSLVWRIRGPRGEPGVED